MRGMGKMEKRSSDFGSKQINAKDGSTTHIRVSMELDI